jgi:hypothetical protein
MRFTVKQLLPYALALAAIAPTVSAQETKVFGAPAGKLAKLEKGFSRLFDGKSLDGWKMCGPGSFALKSDGSIVAEGGMGLLWYTKQKFTNFVLKVDWKAVGNNANSGVFVRFPDPGDDPWGPVNKGYEIQISDSGDALHKTGSLYTFGPSTFVPSKPYGEWNTMEIKAVGTKYTVKVNGKQVSDTVGDRSLEGFVGVQNHDPTAAVAYRNIRIKTLK